MAITNKKALSVIGERFGNWLVLCVMPRRPDYVVCECQCEDKTKKPVNVYSLTSGKSKSCGCASANLMRKTIKERNPNG